MGCSLQLHVEVRGTTSGGEKVILTRKEGGRQREHPDNALIVVRNIKLDRLADPPTVGGGDLIEISPWAIEVEDLAPILYFYDTKLA